MVFPQQSQIPAGAMLGEGIADIFSIYEQRQQQKELESLLSDPNASPMKKALALSKISPDLAKETLKGARQSELMKYYMQSLPGAEPSVGLGGQVPVTPIAPPEVTSERGITPSREGPKTLLEAIPDETLISGLSIDPISKPLVDAELRRRQQERKLEQQREEMAEKREEATLKATEPYVNKVLDSFQATKTTDAILGQMENLVNRGSLTTPIMAQLLSKAGLSVGILNNPDSEEFDKLSNNLTRDIQKFYGSRILQSEFQNFLRQIPTLMNSPEGRSRIIGNMQKMLLPAELEYETMREIVRENGGKRPRNLREMTLERMEPQLDSWAAEFKADVGGKGREQFAERVEIISPQGRRFSVPRERVEEAISQGGKRA
jgi:hypothetical protein